MAINRMELLEYVSTLSKPAKQLFIIAADMVHCSGLDTLSEEFQIAAAVERVFEERAAFRAAVEKTL